MFWFLLWTLVCCSAKPTAVECYLFIWRYFNEVCYWSELHIYFVNHECLRYKFVYFNNKCHTKQTCWCKTWVGFFKAFGPSYLWKQIYGTIEIFVLKPEDFYLWSDINKVLILRLHLSFALNLSTPSVSRFVSRCALQNRTKSVNEGARVQLIYWPEEKKKLPLGHHFSNISERRPHYNSKDQFPDGESQTEPLCGRTRRERRRKRETDGWKSCEAWGTFCWLEQEEVTESLIWPVRLEAAWGRWHIQGNVLARPPAAAVFIPGSLFGAVGAGEVEHGRLARTICTLGGTSRVPLGARYPTDVSAWLMPFKSTRGCGGCNQLCRDVEIWREFGMILLTASWTAEGTPEVKPV